MGHQKIGSDLQQALSRCSGSNDARDSKTRGGALREKLELLSNAKRQLLERRACRTVDERDAWKVDDAAQSGPADAVNDLFG